VDIIRDGKEQQITVKLEARPDVEKTAEPKESTIKGTAWLGVSLLDITPEIAKQMDLKRDKKVR
jgi:hypothetical protein